MNKAMRKAEKALATALQVCEKVKVDKEKAKKLFTIEVPKTVVSHEPKVESCINPNAPRLTDFKIVKIQKGDFRVEIDGKTVDKKFKSVTAAQEWCAVHVK